MNLLIDFAANPLVPVVIQDDASRNVLMVAFMNQLAFERTLETGFVHFWSRSRNKLWKKGETSGHTQEVVSMAINCEDNSLLIQVVQTGAVCHTGHLTCYYRQVLPGGTLFETSDPVFDPESVYQPHKPTIEQVWFGAYEYLRDNDLSEVSQTSRIFHELGPIPFNRIGDELEELAGVLSGEHVHLDRESDLLLEGSQVLYWVAVCGAICQFHYNSDLWIPAGLRPRSDVQVNKSFIASLRDQAEFWRAEEPYEWESNFQYTVYLVGGALGGSGIDPLRLIKRDLAELRSKPYLGGYFASVDA